MLFCYGFIFSIGVSFTVGFSSALSDVGFSSALSDVGFSSALSDVGFSSALKWCRI